MTECIFCRIIDGQMSAEVLHDDEQVVAIRDINPQAPTHVVILPRQHIATHNDLSAAEAPLIGHMHLVAAELARQERIAEDGYRTVMNCNANGGQSVYHIHLHLLGGRRLQWPPG